MIGLSDTELLMEFRQKYEELWIKFLKDRGIYQDWLKECCVD